MKNLLSFSNPGENVAPVSIEDAIKEELQVNFVIINSNLEANWDNYVGFEQCGGGGRQKKAPCSSSNFKVFLYL